MLQLKGLSAIRNTPASQTQAPESLAEKKGGYILSGCLANAASYECGLQRQGHLTYSLLKGIWGAAFCSFENEKI